MEGGISYLENYILDHKQEQQVLKTNCYNKDYFNISNCTKPPKVTHQSMCVFPSPLVFITKTNQNPKPSRYSSDMSPVRNLVVSD